MLRLRGDQNSLLAALLLHWSEQQLQLPMVEAPGKRCSTVRRLSADHPKQT